VSRWDLMNTIKGKFRGRPATRDLRTRSVAALLGGVPRDVLARLLAAGEAEEPEEERREDPGDPIRKRLLEQEVELADLRDRRASLQRKAEEAGRANPNAPQTAITAWSPEPEMTPCMTRCVREAVEDGLGPLCGIRFKLRFNDRWRGPWASHSGRFRSGLRAERAESIRHATANLVFYSLSFLA
jgi:hypothetical protein